MNSISAFQTADIGQTGRLQNPKGRERHSLEMQQTAPDLFVYFGCTRKRSGACMQGETVVK